MSDVTPVGSLEELNEILGSHETVVVKFWATWCRPCANFAPHYASAATKSNAKFVDVDIDTANDIVVEYGVQSIPAVKLFKDGEFVTDLVRTPKDKTVLKLLAELAQNERL